MISEKERVIRHMGLGDKAARAYLAALELGECSVQDMAHHAGLKRTSLYYVLDELQDAGAIFQIQKEKKVRYVPELPSTLLKRARQRLDGDELEISRLGMPSHGLFRKPHIYFLYGPKGFKKIWDMVFAAPERKFCILTDPRHFLGFVREKYILASIIETKRKKNITSRQIIVDTSESRRIVGKDSQENRRSKILPPKHKLPFTEIITEGFAAFISPRADNTLFVVENEKFAATRQALFDALWDALPSPTAAR